MKRKKEMILTEEQEKSFESDMKIADQLFNNLLTYIRESKIQMNNPVMFLFITQALGATLKMTSHKSLEHARLLIDNMKSTILNALSDSGWE